MRCETFIQTAARVLGKDWRDQWSTAMGVSKPSIRVILSRAKNEREPLPARWVTEIEWLDSVPRKYWPTRWQKGESK